MKSGLLTKYGRYTAGAGLLMLLMIQACAPARHIASRNSSGEWNRAERAERAERLKFFGHLQNYQLDFSTVNARAKGFLTVNDKENHEVNVQLRMQKGKAIWVSVTAFLGMEVGRLLLTPDSIRVINRLDGVFMTKPYAAIRTFVGKEMPFGELQNVLVGNVPDSAKAAVMDLALFIEGGALRTEDMPREELYFNNNFRLVTFKTMSGLEANHEYPADPDYPGHPAFPGKTSLTVRSPRLKLTTTMDYNRLVLDQPVEMPFHIPKGYNQIH